MHGSNAYKLNDLYKKLKEIIIWDNLLWKKKTNIFYNVNGNINVRERSLHKKKENKKFMWFTEIEVIFLYDSQNRAINLRKNE